MMTKATLRDIILALALFFNPFGYNEVFAGIMHYTKSYWITAGVLYVVAGILFITYLVLKVTEKK